MPRHFLPIPLLLIVAVLSLAAVACNGDDDDTAAPTPTTTDATATEPPDPTVDGTTEPPFEGGREPVEHNFLDFEGVPPIPTLMDVRAATQEGFDRVVFEFADNPPGYRVEYVDEAIECGSGNVAEVGGAAILQVRMQPGAGHNEDFTPTFGPQTISAGLPSIVELVRTCDFEAEVTWAIGLTAEVDFAVTDLTDPFRVVVDVAHPE